MAVLGELAVGVVHNFGNVLMGVSVTLELLQMRATSEPGLGDLMEAITGAQAEVDRGADIIQRLLSLSRGTPPVVTAVDPSTVADGAIALCSTHVKAKKVRLVNLIPHDSPSVKTDAGQLTEVLVNLMLNALQASEDGEVRVEMEETDDRVNISVADGGCGIAPEDMDRLFDPFFSKRKEGAGTGLGLPYSYQQVTNMGGTVEVSSTLGMGSTFTVNLPKWTER